MEGIESLEDMRRYQRGAGRRAATTVAASAAFLAALFFVTLTIGNYGISLGDVFGILLGSVRDDTAEYVLKDVRIPRLLCAVIVGSALSTSGLAMQSMFKNPMASPSVLGISSGAAFGASLALAFGAGSFLGSFAVPGMAFIFCFLTMGAVYLIAHTKYGVASVTLLLAGIAMGAFFGGLTSLMQYMVRDDVLASIVYWTMGSFNNCGWTSFKLAILPIAAGIAIMMLSVRELNLISSGEDQASNMGVNVKRLRIMMIVAASLSVGGSVAISGVIGFVGLIVPHIFRMIAGPNHAVLMPLCVFGGGAFMLLMDTVAKSAFEMILPVGVLTSLVGAPFFIYVMRARKKELWG
ncbi:MAG: iron ABC transporter permease [Candidatus Methanoplasma sp.]|jgi:iron complex transport system permease protein|nr:iron ABC transporter permease [Candidatus Methanoplasma sp.]